MAMIVTTCTTAAATGTFSRTSGRTPANPAPRRHPRSRSPVISSTPYPTLSLHRLLPLRRSAARPGTPLPASLPSSGLSSPFPLLPLRPSPRGGRPAASVPTATAVLSCGRRGPAFGGASGAASPHSPCAVAPAVLLAPASPLSSPSSPSSATTAAARNPAVAAAAAVASGDVGATVQLKGTLETARAIWVTRDLIAVPWTPTPAPDPQAALSVQGPSGAATGSTSGGNNGSSSSKDGRRVVRLHASWSADLQLTHEGVQGADEVLELQWEEGGLPSEARELYPHIAGYAAVRLPSEATAHVPRLVKCQLALSCCSPGGEAEDATAVQVTGVLDDCFSYDGPLGVTAAAVVENPPVSIHLWAPTAQSVELLLFDAPHGSEPVMRVPMVAGSRGEWSAASPTEAEGSSGGSNWWGLYYQYVVRVFHPYTRAVETCTVTDPYSRGLSANGERSLLVDLAALSRHFSPSNAATLRLPGDPPVQPDGWSALHLDKPVLDHFADVSIYELHIRDFSASDETVEVSRRGTYLAFAEKESNGVKHLQQLSEAGLTHVHLLPSYDFASVNEDKSTWKTVDEEQLRQLPPDSDEQQAAVVAIQNEDGFNWGYDPVHWGLPDGSYATDPDGIIRTYEYRSMVQALNRMGLRVVVDVVYNHLDSSGPHSKYSVLDKVVPGYYLRRNAEGYVEGSACCNDTASEHRMVERLIVDDIVAWATLYKVDGFRFDLMGHLMKRTLDKARAALDSLTVDSDGVDGRSIYMYGEGWDFGEVYRNARGVNGSQLNLAGSHIGSFNDRVRDSVLGGSPFGHPKQQGFLTGLLLQPNEWEARDLPKTAEAQGQSSRGEDEARDEKTAEAAAAVAEAAAEEVGSVRGEWAQRLAWYTDCVQLAMAGNLRSLSLPSRSQGRQVSASELTMFDGTPVAYAANPDETINYISAHDNETLFDIVSIKAAADVSRTDRIRMCNLATSLLALSQGVPFFHAGDEMLRSKSLDRDSYNSGDWFNRLDFSYSNNNFGVGLPPKDKNGDKWDMMRPLLAAADALRPSSDEIRRSAQHMRDMLAVRYSSRLFRLRTPDDIQRRVTFYTSSPEEATAAAHEASEPKAEAEAGATAAASAHVPDGVIVMRIVDGPSAHSSKEPGKEDEREEGTHLPQLDSRYRSVVVVVSARPDSCTVSVPQLQRVHLALHPILEKAHRGGNHESRQGSLLEPSFDAEAARFHLGPHSAAVFMENR